MKIETKFHSPLINDFRCKGEHQLRRVAEIGIACFIPLSESGKIEMRISLHDAKARFIPLLARIRDVWELVIQVGELLDVATLFEMFQTLLQLEGVDFIHVCGCLSSHGGTDFKFIEGGMLPPYPPLAYGVQARFSSRYLEGGFKG